MKKFNWSDDFNIHNEIIDSQHQYLFELANKVYETDDRQEMIDHALALFQYVRTHFKDEESLMRQVNYPNYPAHIEAHNQILLRLEKITTHLTDGKINHDDINSLMVDWLLTHILKEDAGIGDFLKSS